MGERDKLIKPDKSREFFEFRSERWLATNPRMKQALTEASTSYEKLKAQFRQSLLAENQRELDQKSKDVLNKIFFRGNSAKSALNGGTETAEIGLSRSAAQI
ncbi:MAG: hypothetical protein NZO16_03750, partial [Deltaproteobacteria bacterium]|nr:hypothetical protein [Deltaproteobacteria bacterium]